MTFLWTQHRFSGGALALDVANSVVLRFDPERRIDRYEDVSAMDSFSEAANRFCAERATLGPVMPVLPGNRAGFLALRDAIDGYFRTQAQEHSAKPPGLADLLEAAAQVIRRQSSPALTLDAATAHSALSLAVSRPGGRLKICPNCEWLFLDRSRAGNRLWCDMAVCGNRAKAARHYRRSKSERMP